MSVSSYTLANGEARWLFVVDVASGPTGKKRTQIRRRGFLSEVAAQKAEKKYLSQFGEAILSVNGSVKAELEAWLAERELDLAATSLSNYRDKIKYVVKHLGHRDIYSLDKNDINKMYKDLLAKGGRTGGALSAETVRTVHRIFMKALADLEIAIPGVRQPREADKEHDHGRKGVWSEDDALRFLDHVRSDRLYAAWVLALVGGVRRGELAGLKWPKVDLKKGVVHIHWQRAVATGVVEGGVIEKAPKGKSKRSIAAGAALVEVLANHEVAQRREEVAGGIGYRRLGYVYCKQDGTPYHPKYFTDRFRSLCVEAGVPVIALHDGRHSNITIGRDNGVPQHAMQRRAGHARSRTTEDFYTHLLPETERKAADIMEATLLKGQGRNVSTHSHAVELAA